MDADSVDLLSARSLSRMPLFQGFSYAELSELRGAMEVQRKPQGVTILREGQIGGRDFFVLIEGSVEIRDNGALLATRGPNALFGEIAFIANRRRTASVIAAADCVLLRVMADRMKAMLERNPMVAWKLMEAISRLVCDRYIELDKRVKELLKDAPAPLQEGYSRARLEAMDLAPRAE